MQGARNASAAGGVASSLQLQAVQCQDRIVGPGVGGEGIEAGGERKVARSSGQSEKHDHRHIWHLREARDRKGAGCSCGTRPSILLSQFEQRTQDGSRAHSKFRRTLRIFTLHIVKRAQTGLATSE